MTQASIPSASPDASLAAQKRPTIWSEAIWLERLEAAVGADRRAASPIAAAFPSMLVALGWLGTARSLAALLPSDDTPMTLEHLELILPALGFRTCREVAVGGPSDTSRLPTGSLARARTGDFGVYLGRPDGQDLWLVDGGYRDLVLSHGDTILAVEPDINFHAVNEARPNWFRGLFEQMRDQIFSLLTVSFFINMAALSVSLYTLVVYSVVIPSGATATIWSLALLALVVVTGGWILSVGRHFQSSAMGAWAGTRIGTATMGKTLALPVETTTRLGALNNLIRMRGFENAHTFLSGAGGLNLIDYPFMVIFLVVIALVGGWLVFVPIVALISYAGSPFRSPTTWAANRPLPAVHPAVSKRTRYLPSKA